MSQIFSLSLSPLTQDSLALSSLAYIFTLQGKGFYLLLCLNFITINASILKLHFIAIFSWSLSINHFPICHLFCPSVVLSIEDTVLYRPYTKSTSFILCSVGRRDKAVVFLISPLNFQQSSTKSVSLHCLYLLHVPYTIKFYFLFTIFQAIRFVM